jgi:dihydrofolate reductase
VNWAVDNQHAQFGQEVFVRRIRDAVAASLDGFIAGPNGEAVWTIMDRDIDIRAMFGQFATVLIGRRTFEVNYNRTLFSSLVW